MKTKRTLVVMFMLVLALLAGVFPGGAAFAEGGGDPLALRFVCDETVASVTVYDPAGLPLPVGADGIHHLTPGTYFYSATAEGYESTGLQAFTIPADAVGDQELRISLTPVTDSVPPGASTPGETLPDASVPGQTPVNAPDPNAPEENPEDDGKLRIRPVDGSLTLTIERETKAESAVPPELQKLLEGKQKPLLTADGKPVEKKLWLKTPDAEELYLDRLAVEKEIGYYTTDWTVLNLTDEEGDRKNLLPASGWYDVTVSGPATEQYRDYEPVFALLTLHWNEEGEIIDRDVQILETTHTPTKSSWSFSTDTLSTLVIAVPTDRPYIDETAKKPALTERTLVSGDGKVEVSGLLPEDAQLVVVEIPLNFAAELYSIRTGEAKAEEEILFAYDISILSGGEKFQPEDFGESVRVSVGGLNTEDGVSDVLHLKADAVNQAGDLDLSSVGAAGSAESELLPASAEGDTVLFETDGFSVFVGSSASAPAVRAASVIHDGDYDIDFDSGTITKCRAKGDVVIPTEIAGVSVRRIGEGAFTDYSTTSISVTIPKGVSINPSAFVSCIGLRSVTLPENLSGIPDGAFQGCENLVSVTIPKNVRTISTWAFSDCKRLQNVTFEDGSKLSEIGQCAFYRCSSLKSIEIPASVTSIGNGAYADCGNLENVTFAAGSNLASIGDSAFYRCSSLKRIEIPASVTSIGNNAFESCGNLGSVTFVAGSELTRIGASAFRYCDSLTSITIPASVTGIDHDAFFSCRKLGRVTFAKGSALEVIGVNAFASCESLTSIAIPAGVESIGENAFLNCGYLGSVTFVAGSQLTRIGASAFSGCNSLKSIEIPSSVTSIEASAFKYCTNLKDIWYHGTEAQWKIICSNNGDAPAATVVHYVLSITAASDPAEGGTVTISSVPGAPAVSGPGKAWSNTNVTITATPNSGCYFKYWTENGSVVTGTDGNPVGATYTFTATADRNLVANFARLAPVTGEVKVKKTLTGRAWTEEDSFEFTLSAGTGTPMPPAKTLTITNTDTDHTQSFGEIEFTQAGTYTYTVTETKGALDGVSYDTTAHTVTITLEDDGKGNLVAPSGSTLKPTEKFTNTYSVGSLTVSKTVESQTAGDKQTAFGFTVTLNNTAINGTYGDMTFTDGVATFSLKDGETETASSLPAGVSYTVTEEDTAGFTTTKTGDTGTISATQSAATFTNKRIFEYTTDGTSATITKYWGDDASFSIPQTLTVSGGTCPVTTIGDLAFFQCVNLESVEIPSSVTTIRSKAFEYCTNLTSVTFADGSALTSIGNFAFSGSGLGSIEIPSRVTSIGASAFLSCGNLESVTFAEGSALTSMGESAFQLCKKLTSVKIPSGVTSIENYAFSGSGLGSIDIPSRVTSIGNYAFNACSRLVSIEIPAGVKSIGVDAFRDCESLKSVTIPSSVTSIGNFAFCSCSKLESVTIPSSVTSMGKSAFQHCKKLTSVTIERSDPATVLAIGSDAFLCGTDSATLSWTGNTPAGQGVVFTVSPDTAGYSISGTTLSWNANPNSTAEATLRATFVQLPSAKLEVTKEFNDWGKADSFTFTLAPVDNAPMPANSTTVPANNTTATATATEDTPTASFGEITYDKAGTYKYTITEVNGGADGVRYDTTPHNVVVTVSKDNNTNALTATVKYDEQPYLNVTNIFETTKATLEVTKEFNDWGKADSFTFNLAAVTENAPMPAKSTATATEQNKKATFGEITYDKAGTYKYTITEVNGGADGVRYDTTPHNVVVTVTKAEDATNALTATVKYDGEASLTVKNTFTPATAPTITGPENLTLTYGYTTDNKLSVTATPATDGTYDLGYQWYSCEDTVKTNPQKIDLATEASYAIPTGKSAETTEYYYCEVTATRTDNGQTATASSAVATVTINRVPAPTSLTDAQKPTPTAPTADGTPQALVIPPQELPSGYTGVKYSIDGGTNWTELNVVPTAIVPDTYVVQVLYVPDGNHTAIEGTPVKAVILPNYNVVEAESTSSWLKGSRDDAVIKVRLRGLSGKDDNSFQHFKSVAIDGAVLSEDSSALIQKDYKAEEGSTVITLHKKMLNRLSAGPHTVTITFDNGEVEAPLTILVPPGGYSPATGDSARIGFWAALMVLAGLGFAGANYARRRLRRPRYVGKH